MTAKQEGLIFDNSTELLREVLRPTTSLAEILIIAGKQQLLNTATQKLIQINELDVHMVKDHSAPYMCCGKVYLLVQ